MRGQRFQRNPLFVNHVQDLVKELIQQALMKENKACIDERDRLVEDNAVLGGNPYGFFYNGDIISPYAPSSYRGQTILPIDQSLEERAEAHVERHAKLERDRQKIEAGFSVVTTKCRNTQDIRDTLPDTLVTLVPAIAEIPRSRSEGFLFETNPLLKKQFEDILTLLFDYQFKHQMDALAGIS